MAKSQSKPAAKKKSSGKAAPEQSVDNSNVQRRLPSAWRLSMYALRVLWRHRKSFIGISLIYVVLSIVLVQSLTGSLNSADLRSLLSGGTDRLTNGILTFEWLLGGVNSSQDASTGMYEILLMVVVSLAVIWALREFANGKTIRIRDSFYSGMYPLVPFVIVALIGVVETLPGLIGLGIYNVMVNFGFAQHIIFRILWAIPALGLVILSLYLVTSTILALYITSIPEMAPVAALKAARDLVRGRRWTVLRKLVFLPIALVIVTFILMVPVLLTVPLAAPWLLFLLTILYVPVAHSYGYALYRELLYEADE